MPSPCPLACDDWLDLNVQLRDVGCLLGNGGRLSEVWLEGESGGGKGRGGKGGREGREGRSNKGMCTVSCRL